MHILISGGTGLIGKALTKYLLEKKYNITILTRTIPSVEQQVTGVQYAYWNVTKHTIDIQAVCSADYIIHLAGTNVAEKRWTKKRRQEIIDSRVQSTKLLANTLKNNPHKTKAFISASGIGWYGADKNGKMFTEKDLFATDFLGETCRKWEESLQPIADIRIRTASIRTGIVLSNNGGALAEFKKPIKFGIAPILGNGKQIISWIHMDDLVRLYTYVVEHEALYGPFNAVAPKPVSNKTLMLALAKKMCRKFYIPLYIPSFMLKLLLGEMSIEVLKSTTVSCEKIQQEGFVFQFPSLQAALDELMLNKEQKSTRE